MEIGIGLPNAVPGAEGRAMVEWARRAEGRGFSSLGTIDRTIYPSHEPLASPVVAAAATERIRIFPYILISPPRNTGLLAQAGGQDRQPLGRARARPRRGLAR